MTRIVLIGCVSLMVILACGREHLSQYTKRRNTTGRYIHINDSVLFLQGLSQDTSYGRSARRPIFLGVIDVEEGAANVEKYLRALRGPDGQSIIYIRLKPCCPFVTPNFVYTIPQFDKTFDHQRGMLERYEVRYENIKQPVILYFNLYDQTNDLLAPAGFDFVKK